MKFKKKFSKKRGFKKNRVSKNKRTNLVSRGGIRL